MMVSRFQIRWKAFSVCKFGNMPDENEDAFYPKLTEGNFLLPNVFSCALSDGATQTSFSSLWASLLVEETCQQRSEALAHNLNNIVESASDKWLGALTNINLPWHAEEKVKYGSFATLLWLTITPNSTPESNGIWNVVAIGDSCLFHVRGKKLLLSHPITNSACFNNHPLLISSKQAQNSAIKENFSDFIFQGVWQANDEFWLASDAMAQWLLSEIEVNHAPFEKLHSVIGTMDLNHFEHWISSLREEKQIKNDDTTLIRVKILPS